MPRIPVPMLVLDVMLLFVDRSPLQKFVLGVGNKTPLKSLDLWGVYDNASSYTYLASGNE